MKKYQIAIIGGGPAGMMAAIIAARAGASVCILDHKERIGNKILVTGNGKCNLTNLKMTSNCYYSDSGEDYFKVISKFSEKDLIAFFEELGIYTHEKNGYIYPASEQASTILDALRYELERLKVEIITGIEIKSIKKHFIIETTSGQLVADSIILSCGSKASSKTGSDGSGYKLADYFGHNIIRPIPALTQLKCSGDFWKEVSGVRVLARLKVFINGKESASEQGELQLADYGISGIPTFIISRVVARAIEAKQKQYIEIDFLPEYEQAQLTKMLKKCFTHNSSLACVDALNGLLPKKLSSVLLKHEGIKPSVECGQTDDEVYNKLAKCIKHFIVKPYDTTGFEHAQVCAGGVDLKEINLSTMESRLVNGLYFAGEILDVDGICGGYNLQWAFSSGYLAGLSASQESNNR